MAAAPAAQHCGACSQARPIPTTGAAAPRAPSGLCYTPLATDRHQRVGTRERLLDVAARHPDRLRIELDALATRVLFDDDNRAVGVEYLKGERLYRARPGGLPATPASDAAITRGAR